MTGIAGNYGGRVRSDCLVEVELTGSGGLQLKITSKVDALYGKSNRDLVLRILGHFGIRNANVRIQDSGALEFVIAARMESALKKAIRETHDVSGEPDQRKSAAESRSGALVEFLPGVQGKKKTGLSPPAPLRDRFRFTRLYLPGNTPGMMLNAGIHKPDGIILDLEDSVAPQAKEDARIMVRNALRSLDFYGAERMVRINQGGTGIKDLECILPQEPDLLLIPKTENPDEIRRVEEKIRDILPGREVLLMPILESATGIERAFEIASASDLVVAMAIGLEDYTSDLGVRRTGEGQESLWARSRMVNACKAAGIQAIDSVYSDVADEEGLRNTVIRSKAMGFEGMGCIHPRQIPIIKDAFRPETVEMEWAMQVVLAFEEAEKNGLGVVSMGSKMIDPPVVKRALRIIDLAINLDMTDGNWREDSTGQIRSDT